MQKMQYEKTAIRFDNLVIRWTFGETKERPTSLQAFDLLETSIRFANLLFPEAEKILVISHIIYPNSFEKIKEIARNTGTDLLEVPNTWDNNEKNSFLKYIPARINPDKYELFLDADVILWKIPETLKQWIKQSDAFLVNSDRNGNYYGVYQNVFPSDLKLNAGILGFPPGFQIELPDVEKLPEKFHSEQGFVLSELLHSQKKLFVLRKKEIFQSNAKEYINTKYKNLTEDFTGAHFCGTLYAHYFHWDKFYKHDVHKYLEQKIKEKNFFNLRDLAKHNPNIKQGFIFRSGTLTFLQGNPELDRFLKEKNIGTIIDLRAPREIQEFSYSQDFLEKINYVNIPFDPWAQPEDFRQKYHPLKYPVKIAYLFFLLGCKTQIKKVMQIIINTSENILIHCHAGKDRTGIIAVILHLLTKNSLENIEADYLESKSDTLPQRLKWIFKEIEKHRGVENYLLSCGLSENEIKTLKNKLKK